MLTTQKFTKQKKSLPGIFPRQLKNGGKPHNSGASFKVSTDSWKENRNFPSPPSHPQAAEESTPDSCRASSCCQGLPLTPAPRTTHATGSEKASSLPYRKCHQPISPLTLCRQVPTQGTGCTTTSEPHCPHPSKRTGGHLPPGPAGVLQPRRKSLSGSQTRKEPETNAASDGQWREFYYYPIITLGSVPK